MDTTTLKYFMEIASGRTFWEVAEDFNTSQSSVSKAIVRLEEELDIKLFNRSKRTVSLTPAGSSFYESLRILEPQFNDALEKLQRYRDNTILSVCVSPALEFTRLNFVKIMQGFLDQNNITLNLENADDPSEILQAFADGKYDFLITHRYRDIDSLADYTIVKHDTLNLVMPLSNRFADRESVSIEEIEDESIVIRSKIIQRVLSESCAYAEIPYPKNVKIYDMSSAELSRVRILDQVASGQDVTLYFDSDLSIFNLRNLHVCPITGCPEFPIVLAKKKGRILPPLFGECWDYLCDILTNDDIW